VRHLPEGQSDLYGCGLWCNIIRKFVTATTHTYLGWNLEFILVDWQGNVGESLAVPPSSSESLNDLLNDQTY